MKIREFPKGKPAQNARLQTLERIGASSTLLPNPQWRQTADSPHASTANASPSPAASTRTIPGSNDTAQVTGNLTIRDITREVTFAVKFLGYGPDHANGKRAGFHAETRINRKDFGVSYAGKTPDGRTIIGDDVDLILELEAVEKMPTEATPAK